MSAAKRGLAACGHYGILKASGLLCGNCYQKKRRATLPRATCHPHRKEHCAGLCSPCYRSGIRAKRASCHPGRLHVANGLCRACYRGDPDNKAKAIKVRRLKKYGLSEDGYTAILESQGWKCAICGGEPYAVDHDHATRDARGVLCHKCNAGLGLFRDNPEFLQSAIKYLAKDKELS